MRGSDDGNIHDETSEWMRNIANWFVDNVGEGDEATLYWKFVLMVLFALGSFAVGLLFAPDEENFVNNPWVPPAIGIAVGSILTLLAWNAWVFDGLFSVWDIIKAVAAILVAALVFLLVKRVSNALLGFILAVLVFVLMLILLF